MFGHNDDRSSRGSNAGNDGILTNDDSKAAAVLVGDMTAAYPPTDLPTPGTAPTPPADDLSPALPAPMPTPSITSSPSVSGNGNDTAGAHPDQLLDIKQQALQHLSPLVDHLDQSPADRFRTTMMMIQASDNANLIKAAYDAALQIPDDKARAQALLDLINEINYFTQQNSSKNNEA